MSGAPAFADIDWRGRRVRIEYARIAAERADAPLLVFLHEGLGSLAMWKDFPARLCAALGTRGLVYSRPGYGRSTPRAADERWLPDFMLRQADEVLPALLRSLGVDEAPWLFGHSDGGTIALLHACGHPVAGVMALAPHVLVEPKCVDGIARARQAYENTDLRSKLGRYHDDVDSAFWGWNRIWLDPAFRDWTIEQEISAITCPLLVVQGLDDEYATLEQVHAIARRVPQARIVELAHCGHSPHVDQPDALIDICRRFLAGHAGGGRAAPAQPGQRRVAPG